MSPSSYRKPHAHRRGGADARRELAKPARTKAPTIPKGVTWPASTRRWWAAIWKHEAAAEWDEVADYQAVVRLAGLYADQAEGRPMTAAILAQAIRLENELGLTPAARRRQFTRLPDRAEAKEKTATAARIPRVHVIDPALDPREALR